VTTALVLVSPQGLELFCIEADSSNFASRAILSQWLPRKEKWYPVAFYSKSLSPVISQMATYWFVIGWLDIQKAQKSEV